MPDTKTVEQLEKQVNDLTAQNAELNVLAKMSDDMKTYMSKMPEKDRKAFMALSEEDRKAKMKTAKAADESFTDTTGQTICKSQVGEAAFAIMKSQNDRLAKMEEDHAISEAMELVKSICPELPGTLEEKAGAIRKCRDSLTTEQFGVLEKALKAGDAAMKVRKEPAGHQQPTGSDDARTAYNDGITKLMADKQITKSEAMQSAEGLTLAKTLRAAEAE